jgi:hypothetical protein
MEGRNSPIFAFGHIIFAFGHINLISMAPEIWSTGIVTIVTLGKAIHMQTMRATCTKVLCAVFCCGFVGEWAVKDGPTGQYVSYFFKDTMSASTLTGEVLFLPPYGLYAAADDPYCPEDHRTPHTSGTGNRYSHIHTYEAFPFWTLPNNQGYYVTATKSDWAWDAQYYVHCSSTSTFLGNCFSYATDQPTWGTADGYAAWTSQSSQCEATSLKKSYLPNANHAIVIVQTVIPPLGESTCVIMKTSEKNGTSGVYDLGWGPVGLNLQLSVPVNKRLPSN